MAQIRGTAASVVKALNRAYHNGEVTAEQGVKMFCAVFPEYMPGSPIDRANGSVFYLKGRISTHDENGGLHDLFALLTD